MRRQASSAQAGPLPQGGHVRRDPTVRHGGGESQTRMEGRRLERLSRFLSAVARRLSPEAELVVLGPGAVHERLAREVADEDRHRRIRRAIRVGAAARMANRQLVARLRAASGKRPRRGLRRKG